MTPTIIDEAAAIIHSAYATWRAGEGDSSEERAASARAWLDRYEHANAASAFTGRPVGQDPRECGKQCGPAGVGGTYPACGRPPEHEGDCAMRPTDADRGSVGLPEGATRLNDGTIEWFDVHGAQRIAWLESGLLRCMEPGPEEPRDRPCRADVAAHLLQQPSVRAPAVQMANSRRRKLTLDEWEEAVEYSIEKAREDEDGPFPPRTPDQWASLMVELSPDDDAWLNEPAPTDTREPAPRSAEVMALAMSDEPATDLLGNGIMALLRCRSSHEAADDGEARLLENMRQDGLTEHDVVDGCWCLTPRGRATLRHYGYDDETERCTSAAASPRMRALAARAVEARARDTRSDVEVAKAVASHVLAEPATDTLETPPEAMLAIARGLREEGLEIEAVHETPGDLVRAIMEARAAADTREPDRDAEQRVRDACVMLSCTRKELPSAISRLCEERDMARAELAERNDTREPARVWGPGDPEPTDEEQAGYEAFIDWRSRWEGAQWQHFGKEAHFIAGWCQRGLRGDTSTPEKTYEDGLRDATREAVDLARHPYGYVGKDSALAKEIETYAQALERGDHLRALGKRSAIDTSTPPSEPLGNIGVMVTGENTYALHQRGVLLNEPTDRKSLMTTILRLAGALRKASAHERYPEEVFDARRHAAPAPTSYPPEGWSDCTSKMEGNVSRACSRPTDTAWDEMLWLEDGKVEHLDSEDQGRTIDAEALRWVLGVQAHTDTREPAPDIDHALAIARAALTFGRVTRATMHPDGTPESVATHTVMLAMLVAELAAAEGLDVGLAVQMAVVHDLPETYCGDTCTARALSPEERGAKDAREAASLGRLRDELGQCWSTAMIDAYEAQEVPEARLVKYVDKIMPKLVHVLDGGRSLASIGMSADETEQQHTAQGEKLHAMAPRLTATRALFDSACARAVEARRRGETWDVIGISGGPWPPSEIRLGRSPSGEEQRAEIEEMKARVKAAELDAKAKWDGLQEMTRWRDKALRMVKELKAEVASLEKERIMEAGLSTPEPPPRPTDGRPIWELVIEDMQQRDQEGRRRYGVPLQAGNGRRPLIDAYQEALDLSVYLRQAIKEAADVEAVEDEG